MNILLERYQQLKNQIRNLKPKIKPAIRINTLKGTEEEIVTNLRKKGIKLQKIPFLNHAYWYKATFSLASTPEYLQGQIYIQETASQIPPIILNPEPTDLVLDMAASPGSKTTQIAQLMKNKGVILAIDNDKERIPKLRNNIERLSIKNTIVICIDSSKIKELNITFDKILLDAPCSGNYCIEKDYFLKRSIKDFENRAKIQKKLLIAAHSVLKSGGTLVYSTCSLEPEEDELVIDWFLKNYKDMDLEKINLTIGEPGNTKIFNKNINPEIIKTIKLWPDKTNTQGFFIAKLKKK
ncbi:RsmB/NOP family class I SAM-dependent RNA methyltransferase [Candidatus Woesearchaeota archaeon]|nr:RsmB/NOP family class I SAM-dependent RNA methyltransferase [Candidatus Woesearchaeota archaeon]MCF7900803.1 RsmB/NOP family class I SAM-dependent RNA methyltransferase [Candidatus Woesearchaeota archaeon]MCF8013105.1 RsmB/NOP family class I SAM-dependent RNA methyltransferase [Candidatus Woesearchaeota archaeon]